MLCCLSLDGRRKILKEKRSDCGLLGMGIVMENNVSTAKSEYDEIWTFLLELQEEELKRSEQLLMELKEQESKIRQRERILEEQEKRRSPNITMFSPLDSVDAFDMSAEWKNELEVWKEEMPALIESCDKVKERTAKLERLKQFFAQAETRLHAEEKKEGPLCREDYRIKLLETQEFDRNRISRDLHDSTVQSLTSLVHKTELCSKLLDIDLIRARLELQSMSEMIRAIINDMREIIYDLHPMSLNNFGLETAIDSYCTKIKRNHEFDISFKVTGEEKKLSSIVRVTLYRIVQEACSNVVKHASAHHVIVSISYEEDSMKLEIEDDGIGFDIEKMKEKKIAGEELHGFGLFSMNERAYLLGGTFSIESHQGNGTKITIVVPV